MDHSEAIQGGYVEKYLLGDLTPVQRDLFEDHFFDCPLCSDDVHSGALFVDNARALLRSEETAVPARPLETGFASPFRVASVASVFLLGFVAYQNIVVIPGLRTVSGGARTPEIPLRVSALEMGSRSETNARVIPGDRDVDFDLEIPSGPEFSDYAVKILDSKNSVRFTVPVTSEQATETVPLRIPARFLTPGSYAIEIVGKKGGEKEQELNRVAVAVK